MSTLLKIKQNITEQLRKSALSARQEGEINFVSLPEFTLEVPREKTHGDFATNLAMLLAREAKMAPRQIAEIIVKHFDPNGTWVKRVEVAGPGFINFTLSHEWLYQVLPEAIREDERYGNSNFGQGKKVQVEFVSANPTGLLHMGNARGAALGDSIANLLQATGHEVTREFYVNDAGNQIINFGKSLEARYLQLLGRNVPFPDEGYHGEDLIETVKRFISRYGDRYLDADSEERQQKLIEFALEEKLNHIREVLEDFGVYYDVWFHEQTLHESGAIREVIEELRQKGYIYESEGALWFKSTEFGDEKDEVVVRSNGIPTYFAADIAYHKNKFERGFDRVINIWGADHHGHVARLKGAVAALGYDPARLDIILMQLVRLFKDGEVLRMSKRTGQYVTLGELIEEVGKDAARYFFVMRGADSHLDFDLDLAKAESNENPVYYVQYAHARICSILRQGKELGYELPVVEDTNLELLQDPAELELIRKIADLPDVVAEAAQALEPHRLTRYAHDLASLFHSFYNHCRVLVEDEELRKARMILVDATRITLRNVLQLLGVTAPERM
ncbi:arginine--tRNA ligase [Calderihabitans maritimus]|uniref:Arginine--tRNA ligase n=1 Tax=Calderihabitans maritimus TaxID=1246530 RepID=A0A1Z5HW56_9FIRM|nr:arginine--tRNA ligase [Calderihabitans maritimus]GAW93773.1 arginyl-tRNA synthetase [Calderihabitans maritimus]